MDAERVVAKHIKDTTGIGTYLKVPEVYPAEFVTISRSGSTGERFFKRVQLTVQVWAQTRVKAAELADSTESAIYDLDSITNIFKVECGGFYEWTDPESKMNRYQAIIYITIQ